MEYDRKILVPYLTELYCIEVTYQSLKNKSSKYSKLVENEEYNVSQSYMLNEIIKAPNTKMPRKKSIIGTVLICLVLWFVLGIINDTLGTFVFLASIFIIGGTKQFNNEEYQKRLAKYHEEMEEYQKKFSVLEKNKNIIRHSQSVLPEHQATKKKINVELNSCQDVKDNAYNLNIIPVQYRNLGSIAYLYEYFSTSQATNLDQVIQTMLLDDVRQRIQNIENQLNQMLSNQQRIYEKLSDIQRTASYISRQLDVIELTLQEQIKNSQEQTRYLKMIKTSAEISNYLQLGTYLEISKY